MSLLALVSASLISVPAVSAAAQTLPTEQPQPAELPAADVEGGLTPDDELGGPSHREAVGEMGVLDLLGPDGTYTLRDGDGEILLRLLDPADAASTGAQSGTDQAGLADLAASAATAYAAGPNATASSGLATPSNWFVSDSGQLFLLVGGVNAVFSSQLNEAEVSAVLALHGVATERVSPLGELPNAYLIETVSDAESLRLADALTDEFGVEFAVPNLFTPMSAESDSQSYTTTTASTRAACTPYEEPWTDELSACLWHLKDDTDFRYRGTDPKIDVNLGDVWDTTMGAGVTVAIVDRTWEATHEDLADNVDLARSMVWGDFTGENQAADYPYHGTAVAGIVGARDNAVGGRGVAPRATLVNYNLLDAQSNANQVAAVTLNRESVAVYNLSYADPGFPGPFTWSYLWRRAVEEGLSSGFGGKGSSYVKGAGNGSTLSGSNWATLDEANNQRGVIAVCAVDSQGRSASYSEDGPSLWVCAPSGDGSSGPGILAPIGKDGYSARIGGTSAAAPIVSGVVALTRSANADLTWRDVKVILANTAQKNDASHSSWMSGATEYGSNSESYSFSNEYGFGTVDAQAAVQAATNWTLLPEMLSAEATSSTVVSLPSQGHEIELSLNVDPGDMDFIEHVSIALNGDVYDIRDYEWTLVSPTGTESLLAPRATECRAVTCSLRGTFHFGSSRHLGEDPSGTWKLKVRKYAPDITHCVSDAYSYYGFYGIAQFCRKYRSYDQAIQSWKIVATGHSSASVSLQPVKLTVSPSTVAEGAEIDVTATIQGVAPTQDVVIPLVMTAGTATAAGLPGADYAALATITVPAGASSASAKLATVADDAAEPDETFTVGLGALPSGYRPVTGMPKVTIADDDSPPTVMLHAENSSVAEGDFVMITASLSHPSSEDVTLDVSAAAVAPAAPGDGSMSAWTKLTIAAGATSSTDPVAFIASQNGVDEPADAPVRVFRITATASGGDVADPSAITVAVDDDALPTERGGTQPSAKPTVKIVADGDVIEGDTAAFTLVATPRPTVPLQVGVTASLWTELPQYQGNQGITPGALTVTIPVTGSEKLNFSTTDDEGWGHDLELTAALQTGSDYTLSSTAHTAVVVVMEEDHSSGMAVGTVSVGTSGSSIIEGEDATFTITFDRPAIGSFGGTIPVRLKWSYTGSFIDDSVLTGSFVPGKRELTKTFSVGTLDDGNVEGDGSITLELLPYNDYGYDLYYSVGAPARATISIADNDGDVPEVTVAAGTDVTEGGDAEFTVSRGSPGPTSLTVDVTVAQSGDFAGAGQTGIRQVTINAGDTSVTLPVGTIDDQHDEADGSVSATLVDGSAYDLGTSRTATVTVADDDSSADYSDYQTVVDYLVQVRDNPVNTAVRGNPAHIRKWNQVLAAIGYPSSVAPMEASVIHANAARWPDSPYMAASEYLNSQQQRPEITVSAGSAVSEGTAAEFTVTATPLPTADLDVTVTISQSGDYGATTGSRTVTVPTTGSVTLSVATTDDSSDEADGSVTVTLVDGADYDLGASKTATVNVADDDDSSPDYTDYQTVVDYLVQVRDNPVNTAVRENPAHIRKWNQVLAAVGYPSSVAPMEASVIHANAAKWPDSPFKAASEYLNSQQQPQPEITISAGNDVTEGSPAEFTLTATPHPTADLDVTVTVTAAGDFGATTGSRTVTIPTTGSATLSVATTGDQSDEADGSVTATVTADSGYTVSSSQGTATVAVADDDPTPPPPPPTPVVTISGGSGITEGGNAGFTLTAVPAPTADLDVTVTVTAAGDFGATTGSRTVTIPTTGSATFTVATTGDQTDEPDGSVTATLVDGAEYDLGTSNTATVNVADNDDPPPPPPPPTPVVTISGGGGVTEGGDAGFTLTAVPAPTADLDVTVTVSAAGDYGAVTGSRTVTIPTTGSVTFTVATTGDQTDEPDGSVTATLVDGSAYDLGASNTATVNVADNDDPPPPPLIDPDETVLADCGNTAPTLSISSPTASRSDSTVDFEVSLNCKPVDEIPILLAPVRDGIPGHYIFVSLTSDQPTATITVPIGNERELSLAVGWSSGLANSDTQGDVAFTN